MNSLLRVSALLVLLLFCSGALFAQALEPIGGPYTVDSATVVLLHFDGNLHNDAAATGKTDTALVPHSTNLSNIYFIDNTGVSGLGKAVRLNNGAITDSTYLTLADTAALDLTGSWTIEAWANIFTFGDNSGDYRWVPRVVMKPGDNIFYVNVNYWLEMWGDNRLFHGGYHAQSDAYVSVTSPNNMFVPGEWVHLTFIRDTARAFIAVMVHDANKNLKSFLSKGFDKQKDIPWTNSQPMHIGWAGAKGITTPSTDSYLDGFVDEVRISKSVRNFAGPPVVSNPTILPNQPSTAASYPVKMTAFPLNAGGSITSVVLKYRADTTGAFTQVSLAPGTAPNEYVGAIPGQVFGKHIQYYYKATDNNGLSSVYPAAAEDATNPSLLSFWVYQPNAKLLDLTFEEGPGHDPVDHSPANTKIITHVQKDYSTDVPAGGGSYSWALRPHTGITIDSNWVEAESPFLAAEEFTLDSWIKADSAELHAVRIIINPSAASDWNNANFELSFRTGAPGTPVYTARYWANDGSGAIVVQDTLSATAAHVGHWRHVILERNSKSLQFAMAIKDENDALLFKKVVDAPKPPLMAGAPLRVGRSAFDPTQNWYVGPFRGLIDNVKMYNYPAAGITTGVKGYTEIPLTYSLEQNYPNPFNPTTMIRFSVPKAMQTQLVVYDLLGRQVKTLVNEVLHAGEHTAKWDGTTTTGRSVASGVYFVRMQAGDFRQTMKMMLMR